MRDETPEDRDASGSPEPQSSPFKLVIPPPAMNTRRATRSVTRIHSDSGSQNSPTPPNAGHDDEDEELVTTTHRGRNVKRVSYVESEDADDYEVQPKRKTRSGKSAASMFDDDDDVHTVGHDDPDMDDAGPRRNLRRRQPPRATRNLQGFVVDDPQDTYDLRKRTQAAKVSQSDERQRRAARRSAAANGGRIGGGSKSKRRNSMDSDWAGGSSPSSANSFHGNDNDADADDIEDEVKDLADDDEPEEPQGYTLRRRAPVNYAIPPPLEDLPAPGRKPPPNKRKPRKGPGWSAGGAELGRWMGLQDDSDSDNPARGPKAPLGMGGPFDPAISAAGSGMLPSSFAGGATGTGPSNLGKVTDASLADADPLGVNVNVTFDEVGGLDDHIHSLKEMTILPLLYPEVFQNFNVTPPRGVLFHGPPGTGKTLLARALAASCRSDGKQISFFMRKGADALSKWVGEAERQLRLLFEEARACQPSIIFFDEIDGLAPVRSSKQDQIHASIVSTLLALMDGMDGRGQVVVIGATNRPDSIDPALRRPGRFDREFYFPLPTLPAREKILSIMTKGWNGWTGDEGETKLKGLAKMTKGYGGADLRALCTEAALNAVQRKYPQIYKTNDRLLLKPDSIAVGLRDFMISVKKLVPSSARSSSSVATPLPPQFEPLLAESLEKAKTVLQRVLPMEKRLTALEEAEFEDDDDEEVALEREMLSQAMETLRVHRPRILLHGPAGMGQAYVGAALLHHLEGYSVQSLELGTLLGDATRTPEAAIVQLFVEAKRRQPSIIYIPALVAWCMSVTETTRATVKAMLDTLAPTDPVLLLAIIDGSFKDLPRDVRAWFGPAKENRVELSAPTMSQREKFFDGLVKDIQRPPNQFIDGIKRKKRILEKLPIAPPPEPVKPSAAELAAQSVNDQKIITILRWRLGPILTELKKKFKRFTKRATDEYALDVGPLMAAAAAAVPAVPAPNADVPVNLTDASVDVISVDPVAPAAPDAEMVNGHVEGAPSAPIHQAQMQMQAQLPQALPKLFDMDLETMHTHLYKDRYLTPTQFLEDLKKIVYNAEVYAHEDRDRVLKAQAMYTAAEVSFQDFDATFRIECERMAVREKGRRDEMKKAAAEAKGKGKAVETVTRMSTRSNGQPVELTMTDPTRLERTLKRQRTIDDMSGPSGSEGSGRGTKRTKVINDVPIDVDATGEDDDPLDTLTRRPSVHFADTPHPRSNPHAPGPELHFGGGYNTGGLGSQGFVDGGSGYGHGHHNFPNGVQSFSDNAPAFPNGGQAFPTDGSQGYAVGSQGYTNGHVQQPHPSNVRSLLNEDAGAYSQPYQPHYHQPQQSYPSEPYGQSYDQGGHYVDGYLGAGPSGHAGAGASSQGMPLGGPSSHGMPIGGPSHSREGYPPAHNYSMDGWQQPPQQEPSQLYDTYQPQPGYAQAQPNFALDPALSDLTPQTDELDMVVDPKPKTPTPPPPPPKVPTPLPPKEPTPPPKEPTPPPPRTPTPLPDFHCDEALLTQLVQSLRSSTASLNVEQLEQLRAMCLAAVWRHRTEWDRDALLRELQDAISDFVDEVGMDEDEVAAE
ncbi:AAA-domain-containing protein [Cylindrobasidium torrendii FP15055 ss-10]|uniref:AAA-domain-containing protein n=1 Tax=Cylindrobasidium torrendii FP15055 ss-10 TaxID=1314674 RepID=A0A0D7B2M7_9AGAR|nr:AAA-domain-containing protein [Cylindrobasidium torrendii FP15055 ss-10]